VLDEVCATYRKPARHRHAAHAARTGPVPPVPRLLAGHDPADAAAYWQRTLGDLTGPTILPILAPERGDGRGTSNQEVNALTGRIPVELAEQLRQVAQRHRATVGAVVHAAWGLLLRRYAGVDDVTFGSTLSGRSGNLPGIERTVGLLINTLPVRLRLAADATVADCLRDVHEQLVALREVAHCALVDVRRHSQGPGRSTPVRHILTYQSVPRGGPADHDGLTITPAETWAQTGYPLCAQTSVCTTTLRFRLDYQPGRLQPDTAERLMGALPDAAGNCWPPDRTAGSRTSRRCRPSSGARWCTRSTTPRSATRPAAACTSCSRGRRIARRWRSPSCSARIP